MKHVIAGQDEKSPEQVLEWRLYKGDSEVLALQCREAGAGAWYSVLAIFPDGASRLYAGLPKSSGLVLDTEHRLDPT